MQSHNKQMLWDADDRSPKYKAHRTQKYEYVCLQKCIKLNGKYGKNKITTLFYIFINN